MDKSIVALPVTVEQIAVAIKQMNPSDRQRLLDLVSELTTDQLKQQIIGEAQEAVIQLNAELAQQGVVAPPADEPFIDGLTLGQYLDLSEDERAKLWDKWADSDSWIDDPEGKDARSEEKTSNNLREMSKVERSKT